MRILVGVQTPEGEDAPGAHPVRVYVRLLRQPEEGADGVPAKGSRFGASCSSARFPYGATALRRKRKVRGGSEKACRPFRRSYDDDELARFEGDGVSALSTTGRVAWTPVVPVRFGGSVPSPAPPLVADRFGEKRRTVGGARGFVQRQEGSGAGDGVRL
jgi:hypothetical protein